MEENSRTPFLKQQIITGLSVQSMVEWPEGAEHPFNIEVVDYH
jgi:hypothetical protein